MKSWRLYKVADVAPLMLSGPALITALAIIFKNEKKRRTRKGIDKGGE
jgi:hypothetical protein